MARLPVKDLEVRLALIWMRHIFQAFAKPLLGFNVIHYRAPQSSCLSTDSVIALRLEVKDSSNYLVLVGRSRDLASSTRIQLSLLCRTTDYRHRLLH